MKRITIVLALATLAQTEDLYAEASFLNEGAILLAPEFQADGGWDVRLRAPEFQADGGWDVRLRAPEFQADGGWDVRLRAPEFQAAGGWGEDGDWDETEEEELVEEEVEFEEEAEEEIAGVGGEEVAADVAEFIAELVSVYEAQDTESFERLVSEEYSEIRTSDEDEERLDYYALIDAVRNEVDVANAFQITHSIRRVWSDENGVRVAIQWQMDFEDARSGRTLVRKGVTGLGLAHFEGWQLITQRKEPLFGAITSESLEGREKPGRRERPKGRGR